MRLNVEETQPVVFIRIAFLHKTSQLLQTCWYLQVNMQADMLVEMYTYKMTTWQRTF